MIMLNLNVTQSAHEDVSIHASTDRGGAIGRTLLHIKDARSAKEVIILSNNVSLLTFVDFLPAEHIRTNRTSSVRVQLASGPSKRR